MQDLQFAVISDIHGNRWALEAVLEDINKRNINKIVNLGDSVYGPLDPAGTASILMSLNIPTVRGNEDRLIFELQIGAKIPLTLKYVRENLSPEQIDWLKKIKPLGTIFKEILLFHGTPQSDLKYLIYNVCETGLSYRTDEELLSILGDRNEILFLCGHDHIPNVISLSNGRLIVNPGSVGLPAYDDDFPFYHKVESGTPHATYCIISRIKDRWQVEQHYIPYNYMKAVELAEKNGRFDWSIWLKTGRVKK